MKKFFAMILIAILALSATAFAASYTADDICFDYDETAFEVSFEDRTDDETTVVLSGTDEAWGPTYIRFYLDDLEDGEALPTMDDFAAMPDAEVTQGEWNDFDDVFMYTLENDDGTSQYFFIAPVLDEDGEADELLTVEIGVSEIEDEDALQLRDDLISAVIDSMVIDD